MPIGVTEEHEELRQVVRRWVETECPPAVPRALLDAATERLPGFWGSLVEAEWLGLHLPEEHGGLGYGLPELVVVLEEMGRAAAPGPFLASALTGAVLAAVGGPAAAALLPGLVAGERIGAVALGDAMDATREGDALRVSGRLSPVLSGHLADFFIAPARLPDGAEVWCVIEAGGGGGSSYPASIAVAGVQRSPRRARRSPPAASSKGWTERASTRSQWCSRRPRPSASRNGAWRPPHSTRRSACSSAVRSGSSRV